MLSHIKEEDTSEPYLDFYLGPLIQNLSLSFKSDLEGIILTGNYSEVLDKLINCDYFNLIDVNFIIDVDFRFLLRNFCLTDSPVRFDYIGKDSLGYEKSIINEIKRDKINVLRGEPKDLTYDDITLIKERIESKSYTDLKFLFHGTYHPSFNRNEYIVINC